tara:strand:+ start:901 stop:1326 length:426 start_codon:yes stop_codon:yes gene_type:complete
MKKEIKNNEVFCYPDTLLNKFIPQSWQIQIMQIFISSYKKKISFYTGENHKTYKSMGLFKKKLNEEKKLDGFVFFSYLQFCYDKNKNENLIKKSIDKNFTIYLAREKMIINKKNYLQKKKDLFFFKESNKDLIKVIINSFS